MKHSQEEIAEIVREHDRDQRVQDVAAAILFAVSILGGIYVVAYEWVLR